MIRVAFCSEDKQHIDAHFAQSSNIVIYEFQISSFRAVNTVSFDTEDRNKKHQDVPENSQKTYEQNEEDDRVSQRINAVKDCSILYCSQIGGPAAARLIQNKIYPLKAEAGTRIEDAAERLHHLLIKNPPRWLQKKF